MKRLLVLSVLALTLMGCNNRVPYYVYDAAEKQCEGHQGVFELRHVITDESYWVICKDGYIGKQFNASDVRPK